MTKRRTNRASGFTLTELLGVIMIIGILAGIVLGVAGIASKNAAISAAGADLEQWKNALDEYRLEAGTLVGDTGVAQSVADIIEAVTNTVTDIDTTVLKTVDPWGGEYEYERLGRYTYALRSAGADGNMTTTEDNVTNEREQ